MSQDKQTYSGQRGLGGGKLTTTKPTTQPSQSGDLQKGQGGGKNIGAKPPKK